MAASDPTDNRRQRWPKGAERARVETIKAAREARTLIAQAQQEARRNPHALEVNLAYAQMYLSDIERFMVEAKVGKDGDE